METKYEGGESILLGFSTSSSLHALLLFNVNIPVSSFSGSSTFIGSVPKGLRQAIRHDDKHSKDDVDECGNNHCSYEDEHEYLLLVASADYYLPQLNREKQHPGEKAGQWTAILHMKQECSLLVRGFFPPLVVDD